MYLQNEEQKSTLTCKQNKQILTEFGKKKKNYIKGQIWNIIIIRVQKTLQKIQDGERGNMYLNLF